MIAVTTVDWVPPFAQGLLRDLRLRWALEEAGLDYEMRYVPLSGRDAPDYRARQPFGQIPVYEEDGREMFETGAILLHLAEKSGALAPAGSAEKIEMTVWLFAALNTIEPHLQQLLMLDRFHKDKEWRAGARIPTEAMVLKRLGELAACMGARGYLAADRFTVADIAMTTVLRIVGHTDLVERFPVLAAYKARMQDRPAFRKSLADQLAAIEAHAPKK
jgi:glutathione S-transferase